MVRRKRISGEEGGKGLASPEMNNATASRVWQAPGAGTHTHCY